MVLIYGIFVLLLVALLWFFGVDGYRDWFNFEMCIRDSVMSAGLAEEVAEGDSGQGAVLVFTLVGNHLLCIVRCRQRLAAGELHHVPAAGRFLRHRDGGEPRGVGALQIEAVDIVGPAAAVAEVGDVFLHTGENDTCHIIPRTQGQSGGSRDAPDRDLGAVDIGDVYKRQPRSR